MTYLVREPDGAPISDEGVGSFESGLRIDGTGEYYGFHLVPANALLHLRISGFWSSAAIARFACDLHAAIVLLGCRPGEHLICCDVSGASIQPQEIVTAFQALIANGPTRARRMALFTTRVLSRMQARRIVAVREGIAVFDTQEGALEWLLHDPEAAEAGG